MRIGYVTSSFPFGPREAFLAPELEELRRRGHEVVVVPVRPSGGPVHDHAREFAGATIASSLVGPRVLRGLAGTAARRRAAAFATARDALGEGPLVTRSKNLAVLAKGMWLAGLAERMQLDHVHAYWASTPATVAWIASRLSGVPFSFTAHRWDIAEANRLQAKADAAAFVRTISIDGREELMRRLAAHGPEPVVIHVGVKATPAARGARTGSTCTVVVPAGLVEKKGHRVLLDAAEGLRDTHPHVRFLLAGDGPLRSSLQEAIRVRRLDTVRLLGQLDHRVLLTMYASGEANLVALASITLDDGEREGIPVSLIEAMAHGIPVIATDGGGTSELVGGGGGLLVPERDAVALAGAIGRLAADVGLRRRLGDEARQAITRGFLVERTVDELERCMHASAGRLV